MAPLTDSRSSAPAPRGFTLVEIMVAILILGLVLMAIGSVMHVAIRSWRTGNDMGEIVHAAGISKDIVLRDLHNLVYLRQRQYNWGFQQGLFTAARLYQPEFDKSGVLQLDGRFDLSRLTPPIDLSFRVVDGGNQDRLTFIRSHQSRFAGDPATWGLRRISYFIRDRTLVREETDPFGFRPGQLDESFFNATAAATALAERFMKRDGFDHVFTDVDDPQALPPDQRLLPEEYDMAEPLCEGVEQFNIACGYFKTGEWHETTDWDSSSRQYRMPPQLQTLTDKDQISQVLRIAPQLVVESGGVPSVIQDRGQPDDLPGYIVIQVGTRGPRGLGRMHVFTFFHALPLGEERDVLQLTEDQKLSGDYPPIDLDSLRSSQR